MLTRLQKFEVHLLARTAHADLRNIFWPEVKHKLGLRQDEDDRMLVLNSRQNEKSFERTYRTTSHVMCLCCKSQYLNVVLHLDKCFLQVCGNCDKVHMKLGSAARLNLHMFMIHANVLVQDFTTQEFQLFCQIMQEYRDGKYVR